MKASSYTILPAGPGTNIYTAEPIADGFASVADAQAYIADNALVRVQVVAETRRWLNEAEFAELDRSCVETRAAA